MWYIEFTENTNSGKEQKPMEMLEQLLGTLTDTLASLGIDLEAVKSFVEMIISAIKGLIGGLGA